MLVRVRTKDGLFRVPAERDEDAAVLIDNILTHIPHADGATLTLADEPRTPGRAAGELRGNTLAALGIQHGDLLYAAYGERDAESGKQVDTRAGGSDGGAPSARAAKPPPTRPWETVQQDGVDDYWDTQTGVITRGRDVQFCRHGEMGMCDYCMPLEPYDARYHAEHNIKHLSFHAYLRKQNAGSGGETSFVPPLEEARYTVQVPCPLGQHAPWPAGICTKCQPSAITLQRQPYRMVDHVEFAHPALIENLLEIWRQTNAQRFGFLVGRYEPYTKVPMGIKAVVEAIHEPPQHGDTDGLTLGLPWDDQARIEKLAGQCGMQIVGMVYTDLEAADPTHQDAAKAGLVACKRHNDSFFLSGNEVHFAAQMQLEHPSPSRFSQSGKFNTKFVTCILSGNAQGEVDVAAYQMSEQAMAMAQADMIEASVQPTTVRVKPSEGERYVPEVFFRYTNKYGIDVKESAKPTFPVEYLLVNSTHGFPTAPDPVFRSHAFPVENRPGLHDQSLEALLHGLAAVLGSRELLHGGASAGVASDEHATRAALVHWLSDWHRLAFLGQTHILDDDDLQCAADVAVHHNADEGVDTLLARPGWQTLVAIAREHAAPDVADAPEAPEAPRDAAPPSPASAAAAVTPAGRVPPRAPPRAPRAARDTVTYDGSDSDGVVEMDESDASDYHFDNAHETLATPEGGRGRDSEVACPHCTFHNAPGSTDCEVCGLPL
ncbi:nuclear protein localization protein 4 [Malassezia sp. CBS 17886]|nr:nuclear protein localization protein 4 [Malassezia sp. CBS 17886]